MRLYVPLTRDEFDRLLAVARAERRRPQDQAALLLARSLDPAEPRRDPTTPPVDGRSPRRRAPELAEAAR